MKSLWCGYCKPGRPLFALVLGGLVACSDVTSPASSIWEAELEPVPPAGIMGSVGVLSQFGRSEASILITGGQPGSSYNWRIQTGSCDSPGELVGGSAVYPALSPAASGEAESGATLSRQLDPEASYAAWVLDATGSQPGDPVACGRLVRRS